MDNHPITGQIPEDKVNVIIQKFLNNPKFQLNLSSLIISTLSQRKNMQLTRKIIAEKVLCHDYIKDVETEILQNLFETFEIQNCNTEDLINLKYKNLKLNAVPNDKKAKEDPVFGLISSLSPDSVNQSSNVDPGKLLSILTEEFLSCEDNLKIENYIGDLSNFDGELLLKNEKIFELFQKISQFLKSSNNSDPFLIPNVISFFNKITKITNTKVLCDACIIFMEYVEIIISKFYESAFDITKFYKLTFNVECLNNLFMKFYDGTDVFLRKANSQVLKTMIDKLFSILIMNYRKDNPVYFSEGDSSVSFEFGISTNYILLLFFLLDSNFSMFKVLFRFASFRKYILPKFDDIACQNLVFLDINSCIRSLNKKFCFLWTHSSVIEKVYTTQKVSKKFLIYCWISIKLNFLGLILRYKPLRTKFYQSGIKICNSVDDMEYLNCNTHFKSVLSFAIDVIFDTKKNFEDSCRENLFYLIKEILCDFILYCEVKECCIEKCLMIEELYNNLSYRKEKMFTYLLDDLQLAFKDNIFTHIKN